MFVSASRWWKASAAPRTSSRSLIHAITPVRRLLPCHGFCSFAIVLRRGVLVSSLSFREITLNPKPRNLSPNSGLEGWIWLVATFASQRTLNPKPETLNRTPCDLAPWGFLSRRARSPERVPVTVKDSYWLRVEKLRAWG